VPGFFTRDDAALLGLFATQAAIAIKNAGLLEQVRQDAAIKTTLLRDVNHRVKNNLMRLVEMVRLEREKAPASEPGTRAALSDLENRLHGMEVVHTMLSRSQWRPLSLGDLVTQIVTAALSGSPTGQQIDLAVKAPAEPLWVVPEQAAAVALIINELATNSVKHAFRNRDQGHLEVRLQVESEAPGRRLVRLEYRDDGPGWPEAVLRGACQHVGLHLIQTHVRSPLRGEMTLRNDGGAVVDLSFKLALAE
jgi:two-component sensor histidine kinase